MKTLSQNTTSSACAPETDLQQLVATLVPDEQRISFWPQHFGLIPQWVTLEPRVFGWMDRLCEDYCGKYAGLHRKYWEHSASVLRVSADGHGVSGSYNQNDWLVA